MKTWAIFILTLALWDTSAQKTDSLKLKDISLYYHEYGLATKEPILLLTGGPGNSYRQLEAMATMLQKDFRVILPEQRGTGKSIPTPLDSTTITVEKVTNDLSLLLNELKIKKITVIGHSWGGMLAMGLAANFPEQVKKLILVSPGPHKDVKDGFEILTANYNHSFSSVELNRLNYLNGLALGDNLDSIQQVELRKLSRRPYFYIKPVPDSIFQKISSDRNLRTTEILVKEITRSYNISKKLKKYSGEFYVITGRQDLASFCSYDLKVDIPSIILHWIEESGHFPMYERPDRFYEILLKTLE
ncbi:alpha/beta fold hydrolase [Flagellimonas olearia]|uniref:Alpha/beta fold hydrolase n=1 Tax=Flagellimonas olearia TaxID=552546 RepID=A0A6I1DY27_9FLAO|nr:alpha/beta hydrolase [Allomuricauda olearia]KAB7530353.1 alpha/beta fold hydrolase [Allomuricauda olearia]